MKFKYLQVFRVYGISSPSEDKEIFFLQDKKLNITAFSSSSIDSFCFEMDRRNAIGSLILVGLLGEKNKDKIPKAMEAGIKRLQDDRKKKLRSGTPIVLQIEGEIENLKNSAEREFEDFTIYIAQVHDSDKEKIDNASIYAKNLLSASLFLSADYPIEITKIDSGMYLYDDKKRIYYNFELSASGKGFCSQDFNEKLGEKINSYFNITKKSKSFDKVFRLLSQAIDDSNDNLKRFIFSWTALEIFINKIFNEYEKIFLRILTNSSPDLSKPLFDRIFEIMKNKYRLQDKFITIITFFKDQDAEEMLKEFIKIKKIRDQIFHGENIKEATLPIDSVIKILNKYLKKHLER